MISDTFITKSDVPFAEMRHTRSSTARFKDHMHHTLGIGAVERGCVFYHVNGEKAVLNPGSLVVINPHTLHACNPVSEAERSYYMLHLSLDWCLKVQQSMWKVNRFPGVEKSRIDDEQLYERYCKTMGDLSDNKKSRGEKERMLLDLTGDVFSMASGPETQMNECGDKIEILKKMLSADLEKDLSVNSLAAKINTNPYTLIRRFKAVTGITPHAFRMNCRIEKARLLLKQGIDITETALTCGFFDQSHFHRHFKAMTTLTPREYRVNFVQ